MKFRGFTVRDVQEYLGFTYPQGIYHWFDGKNLPTLDNLYALSEMLQVPVDLMICGNREPIYWFTGSQGNEFSCTGYIAGN